MCEWMNESREKERVHCYDFILIIENTLKDSVWNLKIECLNHTSVV